MRQQQRESGTGSGATGSAILPHAVQAVAIAGASKIADKTIPARARAPAVQGAKDEQIHQSISRKSTESANSDTDPMRSATLTSTPKEARFSNATTRTA